MKITKYQHSCVVLEENGKRLIIDPGILAELPDLDSVVAIISTHIHVDHLDIEAVKKIKRHNPDVQMLGNVDVLPELSELSPHIREIKDGDIIRIEPFTIDVFGSDHAVIHKTVPCHNTALMVNDMLYHPGDSFTIPTKPVQVLAVPAEAPWMKVGEAMDFIEAVKPKTVFPIHDGLLSDFGKNVNYNWLKGSSEQVGAIWRILQPGDSI